ncbi:DUF4304 domain-containing protein [Desulfoscipio gibsoniae]|uniref:DUF4304 domain-containing protein n=1 Tax=Desulfoscipio gibsoniae DSM 7213 TaxID=767817 RepID=R4KRG2_9FIRM|nr:DUF4304 domain-containing protein [Desulfoscipio gibsoniae]AGL03160.1 hypothetical protein Desgi_3849 [Desulfoscipio gibsoniae DSM 7213]
MSNAKRKTTEAMVDWVVPYLMNNGFKGSYPNYRRIRPGQIDLVTFQFSCCDQAFCINIAKCPPEGVRYKTGEFVKPSEVIALHCPQRLYLGVQEGHSYHWFKCNPRRQEIIQKEKYPFVTVYKDTPLKYKYMADDIINLFKKQAEPWWENSEAWWEKGLPTYNKLFMDFFYSFQQSSNMVYRNRRHA